MNRSLMRRVDALNRIFAAQGRMRFVWRETGETAAVSRARIQAEIASGKASEFDHFVVVSWGPPGAG